MSNSTNGPGCDQHQAVDTVLQMGGSIEIAGWHLYHTSFGERDYVLVKFNPKSDPMPESEERFPNDDDGRSDIISKFLRNINR